MHPTWKQNSPTDQLITIRMAMEGHTDNYANRVIDLAKFLEHMEEYFRQLEMLQPYLEGSKQWGKETVALHWDKRRWAIADLPKAIANHPPYHNGDWDVYQINSTVSGDHIGIWFISPKSCHVWKNDGNGGWHLTNLTSIAPPWDSGNWKEWHTKERQKNV